MGFTDQGPLATGPATMPLLLPEDMDLPVEPPTPQRPAPRVNWLFSGVMLGAASWMLVLGVVFAAVGHWVIAGVLLGGIVLCCLAVWRAGRRAARAQRPGRHRADGGSTVD
jgi:hypothetical protein